MTRPSPSPQPAPSPANKADEAPKKAEALRLAQQVKAEVASRLQGPLARPHVDVTTDPSPDPALPPDWGTVHVASFEILEAVERLFQQERYPVQRWGYTGGGKFRRLEVKPKIVLAMTPWPYGMGPFGFHS